MLLVMRVPTERLAVLMLDEVLEHLLLLVQEPTSDAELLVRQRFAEESRETFVDPRKLC